MGDLYMFIVELCFTVQWSIKSIYGFINMQWIF